MNTQAALQPSQTQSPNKRSSGATQLTVVKRDGRIVPFRRDRIRAAIEAAFRDTKKISTADPLPSKLFRSVQEITEAVIIEAEALAKQGERLTVEGIQDTVEVKIIEAGQHDVARDYIRYREQHKAIREDSPSNILINRAGHTSKVRFNPMKVAAQIENGFRAHESIEGYTPESTIAQVNFLTNKVVNQVVGWHQNKEAIDFERICDEIERQLMIEGHYNVAKHLIVQRATNKQQPAKEASAKATKPKAQVKAKAETQTERSFSVKLADDSTKEIKESELREKIERMCKGFEKEVEPEKIFSHSVNNFYSGIREHEIRTSNIMAAKAFIENEPAYSKVAARFLLDSIYEETLGASLFSKSAEKAHKEYFPRYIEMGISYGRLAPELKEFDLEKLANALKLERDLQFQYLGLQTLYDRYLIHEKKKRLETPQIFWMRVAMGLALKEEKKNERAIEFYNALSEFYVVSGTPTLFNAGTTHSQLSSCYLSTVEDDLSHIFKIVADDAQLSKWAGGLGNDWTNVRATGAYIKGTNGESQGVIPFLKVANDTAVAVNQGGKRKGAMCAYLETWHLDIEDFLELRKNTGDERRRTHDMNTANWIPDLFMKRVATNSHWTLFSPNDVPDLHDAYGKTFEKKYLQYEQLAKEGKLKKFKQVEAMGLWRKMLSMLFETGHPWITFKDPSNIRSPQDHVGVVHSSNLCTEILLNTSREETAVCNLASINLVKHTTKAGLDEKRLSQTVRTAIRMLDNVIDINFYPIEEARKANERHRAIGLGLMGFQDALYVRNVPYASHEAVTFADESMEMISYYAILASSELAKERGSYSSFKGSKWDRGILPIDSIKLLQDERGPSYADMDQATRMDWSTVRESIKKHGMRNCNTMAIAPTATISNIVGCTQSIEPTYKNLFVKSNLSGEFTITNPFLVEDLKQAGLWDAEMIDDLKYFDGALNEIERIPQEIKVKYATAFDIDPEWLIECASRRQKWIDMGQSLNLYLSEPSGKKLHEMYMLAWKKGLKTTYYLRSLAATQIEKSTTDVNKRGLQPRWMKNKSASSNVQVSREAPAAKPSVCNLEEGCESCQ